MLVFTVGNAVFLALLQVGVIVGGLCGAAVSQKVASVQAQEVETDAALLVDGGVWLLALPLLWLAAALIIRNHPQTGDAARQSAFLSGLGLLALLVLFMGYLVLNPLY